MQFDFVGRELLFLIGSAARRHALLVLADKKVLVPEKSY